MAVARINLLPRQYLQARMRRRRFSMFATTGLMLLTCELVCGLFLRARAAETLQYREAERLARAATKEAGTHLVDPIRQAAALDVKVALAHRLRTTHHWSRLLATLSREVPEKVVLTCVATSPTRWTRAAEAAANAGEPALKSAAGPGKAAPQTAESEVQGQMNGLLIQGFAVDYMDLSQFAAALNRGGAFASVSLKEARRAPYLGQDAISFQLQCQW